MDVMTAQILWLAGLAIAVPAMVGVIWCLCDKDWRENKTSIDYYFDDLRDADKKANSKSPIA